MSSNVSLQLVGSHSGGSPSTGIWSLMHQSFPTARSHHESARAGHHRSSEVKAVASTLEDVSQNRAQSVFLNWNHDLGLVSVCYFRDASWRATFGLPAPNEHQVGRMPCEDGIASTETKCFKGHAQFCVSVRTVCCVEHKHSACLATCVRAWPIEIIVRGVGESTFFTTQCTCMVMAVLQKVVALFDW